jgi:hypothetical protein
MLVAAPTGGPISNSRMKKLIPRLFLSLALSPLFHRAAAEPLGWLSPLHSPDIEVRRAAVDRLQTLDDPHIPDACLPLLRDEGLSIRRQAARAIGSRSYEIPGNKRPAFIAALTQYRRDAPEDDRAVADRALGLLLHDFSSPVFSVSSNQKWVLYEQRRRPMIADITLTERQLLAPRIPASDPKWESDYDSHIERGKIIQERKPGSRLLKLMATNGTMEDLFRPHWHPAGIALELQPTIQRGFFSPLCLWRSRDGDSRVISVASFQPLYGKRFPHWSTILDFVKWKGKKAIFKIYDCDDGGGPPYDPKGILVSVNIDDWKMALEKE